MIESLEFATEIPKYLKGKDPWEKPEIPMISFKSVLQIPAEYMLDLAKLILNPEQSPKWFSSFMSIATEMGSPLEKKTNHPQRRDEWFLYLHILDES